MEVVLYDSGDQASKWNLILDWQYGIALFSNNLAIGESKSLHESFFRKSKMSSISTPLTDELQAIITTEKIEPDVKSKLNQLRLRILELELRTGNDVSSRTQSRILTDSILANRQVKKVLIWLSKRKCETLNAISFGCQVTNADALAYLEKLQSCGLAELVDRQVSSNLWQVTNLGRELTS